MPRNIKHHPKSHHLKITIITIKNSTPDIFPGEYMGKKIDINQKAHIVF